MLQLIYIGSNKETIAHFSTLPSVPRLNISQDSNKAIAEMGKYKEGIVVAIFEQQGFNKDIVGIKKIKKKYPCTYIILVGNSFDNMNSVAYLRAGVNYTVPTDVTPDTFEELLLFVEKKGSTLQKTEKTYMQRQNRLRKFKLPLWKRCFDIVMSLSALLLFSPLLICTAIAIRLESKGKVIYKSKRVGSNYKIFDFLKFRSMYTGADKRLKDLNNLNQYQTNMAQARDSYSDVLVADDDIFLVSDDFVISEQEYINQKTAEKKNPFVKLEKDPRITKTGHIIRKYSIDELPQLFNILKGDMSVVGNRPLPLYEAELLTSDEYIDRFMAPAGLTGLWQVEKRGRAGKLSAEERTLLDIQYARTFSFTLDMKIIFKTATAFIQKEDV